MRILASGGGTGGHVYPVLAVIAGMRALVARPPTDPKAERRPDGPGPLASPSAARRQTRAAAAPPDSAGLLGSVDVVESSEQVAVRYVGEAGGIEAGLARREGIPFTAVATGQIRGRAPWIAARNLARMVKGARECSALIQEWRPDVVFVTGGYVAAPVAWAAYRARPRVPLLIYLPDLTPGQAIRVTSRLAAKVAVSFDEVKRYFRGKAIVTGYPVRADLFTTEKHEAWTALGLHADLPVLLVFGGSRGARSINRALLSALPELLPRCQVVHVTGKTDWTAVQEATGGERLPAELRERYHAHEYMHDMVHALVAADLVVARAGAATLGEFPAARLPAILVPYPHAGQHQEANAQYMAQRGAALVIGDSELATRLKPVLLDLLDHPERLEAMSAATANLARPDAAKNIAAELLALGAGRPDSWATEVMRK